MKTYQKILLTCAAVGLLFYGCGVKEQPNSRQEAYRLLSKLPEKSYGKPFANDKEGYKEWYYITMSIPESCDLKIEITRKLTGDTKTLIDKEVFKSAPYNHVYGFNNDKNLFIRGVDEVFYEGIQGELEENLDEEFDKALKKLRPYLEEEIQSTIKRVKENIQLK